MPEYLETTVDKFIFRVAADRLYSAEGVWAKPDGARVLVGLSDFLQQRSGDVAFAEVKEPGTKMVFGEEIAVIETIKVNISLGAPASGQVVEVNPDLALAPEVINQDPYGKGWLAAIAASDWEKDSACLLDHQAYFVKMKAEAEEEARKP